MYPRLVVAGRLLLLFAAAGASLVAWDRAWRGDASGAAEADYVCPMHPSVTTHGPSVCPVCRMALEPVRPAPPEPPPVQTFDLVRKRSFGQDVLSPARVDGDGSIVASLYKDELSVLAGDDRAAFVTEVSPSAPQTEIRRTPDAPAPWDRSTAHVRFHVASGASSPPPGRAGWVRIPGRRRDLLVMPSAAVLEGKSGPYVLVASNDGKTLARRDVELGRVVGGLAYVVSGVAAQERVVVRSAFLLDAERRMHADSVTQVPP